MTVAAVLAAYAAGLGLLGPRMLGRARWTSRAPLLAGAALSLVYTRAAGFSATVGFTPFVGALRQGVDQLPGVLRDAVGTFGALNVPLPPAAHWIWWLFVVGLIAAVVGSILAARFIRYHEGALEDEAERALPGPLIKPKQSANR